MFNRYEFIGHLGQDAAVKIMDSGDSVISFSVAIDESYKNKDGQKVEQTQWVSCSIWKKQGVSTAISEYLKKGTKLLVEGKPLARVYNNKEGVATASLECRVNRIVLLSTKSDVQQAPPLNTTSDPITNMYGKLPDNNPFNASSPQDDDLPF